MLSLMIGSILLIVMDSRFPIERRLRDRYGFDREWWIPVIALGIGLGFSIVSLSSLQSAFIEKFEVIALIFSFGVMSAGLGKSGFFRYIAYRSVEFCEGDTAKLVVSMFAVTSLITFFTTNDIVILLLTPIMVEISFQAGIKNAKLLLLAQFIAANTLSMGLLIGSPTNIIIAEAMRIDFFTYLSMMIVPAVTAFLSSLLLIYLTVKIAESNLPLFKGLNFEETYEVPEKNPEPQLTSQMRDWLIIFGFFVTLVALITYMHISLLLCVVPSILVSLGYWHFSGKHKTGVKQPLKQLPYGILFFGMAFFTFAQQFSKTGLLNEKIVPIIQTSAQTPLSALGTVYTSGLLVNIFNDLPASALVAETLPKLQLTATAQTVLTQASLVGLNIGTYVTPIGALAGLIWFNMIRKQLKKEKKQRPEHSIEVPKRTDLVKYGLLHFLFTGLTTGLVLTAEWILLA